MPKKENMKHEITAEELLKMKIMDNESLEDAFCTFRKLSEEYFTIVPEPDVLANYLLESLGNAGFVIVKKKEYLYNDKIDDSDKGAVVPL